MSKPAAPREGSKEEGNCLTWIAPRAVEAFIKEWNKRKARKP